MIAQVGVKWLGEPAEVITFDPSRVPCKFLTPRMRPPVQDAHDTLGVQSAG